MNKKSKKNLKIYGSIIGFILIILILFLVFKPSGLENQQTSYFYDKELGTVKVSYGVQKTSTIFKPFQQAVFFINTSVKTNTAVILEESVLPIPNSQPTCKVIGGNIQIKRNGVNFGGQISLPTVDLPCNPTSSLTPIIRTTFTPTQAGTYTATTTYSVSGNGLVLTATQQSDNNVVVTDTVTDCPNDDLTSWVQERTITGGKIESRERTSYGSPPSCSESIDTEYRTICNSGYQISGTTGNEGPANGELTCELIQTVQDCTTDSSLCTALQLCNSATKQCETKECNANVNETCNDGTVVIIKYCDLTTKLWTSQNGTSCPSGSNNSTGNSTGNSTTNQTLVSVDCYKIFTNSTTKVDSCVKEVKQLATATTACPSGFYNNMTSCEDKITIEEEGLGIVAWILIGLGAIALILIGYIVITKFVLKGRK